MWLQINIFFQTSECVKNSDVGDFNHDMVVVAGLIISETAWFPGIFTHNRL